MWHLTPLKWSSLFERLTRWFGKTTTFGAMGNYKSILKREGKCGGHWPLKFMKIF